MSQIYQYLLLLIIIFSGCSQKRLHNNSKPQTINKLKCEKIALKYDKVTYELDSLMYSRSMQSYGNATFVIVVWELIFDNFLQSEKVENLKRQQSDLSNQYNQNGCNL
jgi:PBP1b-binding outer membrane lipoprotein LpoB